LFGFVRALTGSIAPQANPKLMVNVELFLVVEQKVSELVRDRKILPRLRMASVDANHRLGFVPVKKS
jgi:hypothetical protein